MDPLACWTRLRDHFAQGDLEAAADAAEDLADWLCGGGYRPRGIPRHQHLYALACVLRHIASEGVHAPH